MFLKNSAYLVFATLALYVSSTRATTAIDEAESRVIGGNNNAIKNFPYLVQVWRGSTFICAGSLVSELFVVSAAHCYTTTKPSQMIVVGGASKLTDIGVRRKVIKLIKRAAFAVSTMDQDLAVLKLAKAMKGPNIKPIPLNNQKVIPGVIIQVTGWGVTGENKFNPSNQLRTIRIPVVSKVTCGILYENQTALTNSMFCANKPIGGFCFSDSGGPAVCNGRLCGVVSWGYECARIHYPGVYTGVYSMLAMIQNAMKQ